MNQMEVRKQRDRLLGGLIGLARACSSNPRMENTDQVFIRTLAFLNEDESFDEEQLVNYRLRVRAEKNEVAPGCATCMSKCGNTDDYDMNRMYEADEAVRGRKTALVCLAERIGALADRMHRQGAAPEETEPLARYLEAVLFVLAEDWDPVAYDPYLNMGGEMFAKCVTALAKL